MGKFIVYALQCAINKILDDLIETEDLEKALTQLEKLIPQVRDMVKDKKK